MSILFLILPLFKLQILSPLESLSQSLVHKLIKKLITIPSPNAKAKGVENVEMNSNCA